MSKWLIGLDIDETQLPERTNPHYFESEERTIRDLQSDLNSLKNKGEAVIVHASNGMRHLFDQVETHLAEPDYITCSAATAIYKKTQDGWQLEQGFQDLIASCDYDPEIAEKAAGKFSVLTQTGPEHQTELKRSYYFSDFGVSLEERLVAFEEFSREIEKRAGMKAFYVEGKTDANGLIDPEGPYATIDVLPRVCTKGECINYLAALEGIDADHIIVGGNGDNDISMFRKEFRSIAVGNSQDKLKAHSASLPSSRHLITDGLRSAGVLEGLHHFGIL